MLLLRERKRKRLAQLKILKTAARKFPDVWKSQGKVTDQMVFKLDYNTVFIKAADRKRRKFRFRRTFFSHGFDTSD